MTDEHTTHRPNTVLAIVIVMALLAAAFGVLMYQRQGHALEMAEQQRVATSQAEQDGEEIERLTIELEQTQARLAKATKQVRTVTKARDKAQREAKQARNDAEAKAASATTAVSAPTASSNLTPCQRMGRDDVPFADAYAEWLRSGAPASWDADVDGIPCEKTYGEQTYVP